VIRDETGCFPRESKHQLSSGPAVDGSVSACGPVGIPNY